MDALAEDRTKRFDPTRVLSVLRGCWSSETSALWMPDNPARGQCNVTALVLHEHFGGELLKTRVGAEWHFYNRTDGHVYDLTASQFSAPLEYGDEPATRDEALVGTPREQYGRLSARFLAVSRPSSTTPLRLGRLACDWKRTDGRPSASDQVVAAVGRSAAARSTACAEIVAQGESAATITRSTDLRRVVRGAVGCGASYRDRTPDRDDWDHS
jgi:hypothetical protein